MRPINLILLFCGFLGGGLSAQKTSASVVQADKAPIAYSTVYLPVTKTGTITDGEGKFSLDLTQVADSSRIEISCIGYETATLTAGELKNLPLPIITLATATYVLETAEVSAQLLKTRQKKLGLRGMLNATYGFSTTYSKRLEQGAIMRPEGICRLDEISLNVRELDADSILLDLNIYDFRFSQVGEPLLHERIFLSLGKDQVGKDIAISVVDQDIRTSHPFLVTVRVLKVSGSGLGDFKFAAKTGRGWGRHRVPGGHWVDSYITPALSTLVSYPK